MVQNLASGSLVHRGGGQSLENSGWDSTPLLTFILLYNISVFPFASKQSKKEKEMVQTILMLLIFYFLYTIFVCDSILFV